MYKTKIDWCDSSWNPVTGCFHDCEYCYARKMATRFAGFQPEENPDDYKFRRGGTIVELDGIQARKQKNGKIVPAPYPFGFTPTLHRYKLDEPQYWKSPKTIFVCSMADLFGEWVPDEWIDDVFRACDNAPWHRYMFLTKNPQRLCDRANDRRLPARDNWWYGTSVTNRGDKFFGGRIRDNVFLSVEPILGDMDAGIGSFGGARWIIVGAETGNRKNKVVPEKAWINEIVDAARLTGAAVFMKESLRGIMGEDFRQEWPWETGEEA